MGASSLQEQYHFIQRFDLLLLLLLLLMLLLLLLFL